MFLIHSGPSFSAWFSYYPCQVLVEMLHHPLRGVSPCNCIVFGNTWARHTLMSPTIHFSMRENMLSLRSWRNWWLARILTIQSCRFSASDDTIQWNANIIPCLAKISFPVVLMRMEHVCMITYKLHYYRGTLFMMFTNDLRNYTENNAITCWKEKSDNKIVPILYKMTSSVHQHSFCLFICFPCRAPQFPTRCQFCKFSDFDGKSEKQVSSFC